MNPQNLAIRLLLLGLASISIGCIGQEPEVDRTYGRTYGSSINGTGAFADLLRSRGHEVRVAVRANETLADWADVLVRFSPVPGIPDVDEGDWLDDWLKAKPGRRVVYIPHDYDAEAEFWESIRLAQPTGTDPSSLRKIEKRRDDAKSWVGDLPPRSKSAADPVEWFNVTTSSKGPEVCRTLEGPWAEGVDARAAGLVLHERLRPEREENVLLSGDGSPMAIGWTLDNRSEVLVLANASFLLNAPLVNRARRPLAGRVVDWIGDGPRHVAFLEGRKVAVKPGDDEELSFSPFRLLQVFPFDWIGGHVLAFLGVLALSYAVRLGRASPEAPSGVERPSAHPEALGALMAKTGRVDAARFLLEAYRRWRTPTQVATRKTPAPTPSTPR